MCARSSVKIVWQVPLPSTESGCAKVEDDVESTHMGRQQIKMARVDTSTMESEIETQDSHVSQTQTPDDYYVK